jgi:hypothetical protein
VRQIIEHVLPAAYELLPPEMRTTEAARLILAIGAHASDYRARRLMARTARRGYWLIGPEHVAEVLKFTKGRGPLIEAAADLGYPITMMERAELQAALEHNDTLGFIVARCMLPPHLEALMVDAGSAWRVYRLIWKPRGAAGVPRFWAESYAAAGRLLGVVDSV